MLTYEIDYVPVHFFDDSEEIKIIFENLLKEPKNKISFINPEIYMQQKKCKSLHEYFLSCKYNFVDGIGLLKAINKSCGTSYNYKNRFPGTDFFTYLPEKDINIFLYGSKLENVEKAKLLIEEKYKNIHIVDYCDGYTTFDETLLIERINASNADILIVCTGCPKQELWINKHFDSLNVKIVFGNGGAIDFWSESVKRAPNFLIKHGLEFIYRLFSNFTFKRIKRQSKLVYFFIKYNFRRYKINKK